MATKTTTRKPQIDWDALEIEFVLNPSYTSARTWLREVKKWDDKRIYSGNTQERVRLWSYKRGTIQQEIHSDALSDAKNKLKQLLPELYLKKYEMLGTMLANQEKLSFAERVQLFKLVKVELNEPINTWKAPPLSYQDQNQTELPQEMLRSLLDEANNRADGKSEADRINAKANYIARQKLKKLGVKTKDLDIKEYVQLW